MTDQHIALLLSMISLGVGVWSLTNVLRYVADKVLVKRPPPAIGETWELVQDDNPWRDPLVVVVIIDIQAGWVRYKYPITERLVARDSRPIDRFVELFRRTTA